MTNHDKLTDAERVLVEIWQQVLEVDTVGIDDDYFDLGGDSIHAIVIVARARAAGVDVAAQDLFSARTIREVIATVPQDPAGDLPRSSASRSGSRSPTIP